MKSDIDIARSVIQTEIKWSEAIAKGDADEYKRGFIAGLKQALLLLGHPALNDAYATNRAKLSEKVNRDIPNARDWMITPHSFLSGRSPLQCIISGELELVDNLVDSIVHIGIS